MLEPPIKTAPVSYAAVGCDHAVAPGYALARSTSDVLLSLYKLSPAEQIGVFDEQILSLLHRHIDFDSAWLGQATMTPNGPTLHCSYLHNLAPAFVRQWERIKGSDPLARTEGALNASTFALSVESKAIPPRVRELGRKQNIAHILFAAHTGAVPSHVTHLSLYRGSARDQYEERDFYALQNVIKHVTNVLEQNRLHWMRAMWGSSQYDAIAMFDRNGVLLHSEGPLHELLIAEWTDWNFTALPDTVRLDFTKNSSGSLTGHYLRVDWRTISNFLLVRIELLGSFDRLSPRERAIARMFGYGHTYKQVARQLGISPATVRHHLRQAYGKLSITSKGELSRLLRESASHGQAVAVR